MGTQSRAGTCLLRHSHVHGTEKQGGQDLGKYDCRRGKVAVQWQGDFIAARGEAQKTVRVLGLSALWRPELA